MLWGFEWIGFTGENVGGLVRLRLSDGTGSKFFDPGLVNFLLLRSGWVRSDIFGLRLDLVNLP